MKIIDCIKRVFSDRIVFCTLGALVKHVSGSDKQMYADDWVIREEVISSLCAYAPNSVYVVCNYDEIPLGYITEREAKDTCVNVCSIIARETNAFVDYLFCETLLSNPMRMPSTGMVDFFVNRDEIRTDDVILIGETQDAKECALLRGVKYYDVSKIGELL